MQSCYKIRYTEKVSNCGKNSGIRLIVTDVTEKNIYRFFSDATWFILFMADLDWRFFYSVGYVKKLLHRYTWLKPRRGADFWRNRCNHCNKFYSVTHATDVIFCEQCPRMWRVASTIPVGLFQSRQVFLCRMEQNHPLCVDTWGTSGVMCSVIYNHQTEWGGGEKVYLLRFQNRAHCPPENPLQKAIFNISFVYFPASIKRQTANDSIFSF